MGMVLMERVVWVIQKLVNDKWFPCRDHNGLPLFYNTERAAEAKRRPLGDQYRVLRVED